MPKNSPDAGSYEPRDKLSAPSGFDVKATDKRSTIVIDADNIPADGEQASNHELRNKELFIRGLGESVLRKMTDEDIDLIQNNAKYLAFVESRAKSGAGSRADMNQDVQAAVLKWVDKVRESGSLTEPSHDTTTDDQSGNTDDANNGYANKLTATSNLLLMNLSDRWQSRRERIQRERDEKSNAKRAALAEKNLTPEELSEAQKEFDAKIARRRKFIINGGVIAAGAAVIGGYAAIKFGYVHFDPSKGPAAAYGIGFGRVDPNTIPQPQNGAPASVEPGTPQPKNPGGNQPPLTPDQLPGGPTKAEQAFLMHYFDAPDTSNMPVGPGGKHGINDFSAGSEALLRGDKTGALSDIEKMLRGNPNIAASYFSEFGIADAPKMPSLAEMNNPGVAAKFHSELNAWADGLSPEKRFLYTQQVMTELNTAQFGAPIRLNDYASWGINKTGIKIFGTDKGQVFMDTVVHNDNTMHIPAKLSNGETIVFNGKCLQIDHIIPVESAPAPAPEHIVQVQEVPQRQELPVQKHIRKQPPTPTTPSRPTPPTPVPTPPKPTPPTPTPPTPTQGKNPRLDINANPDLPPQVQMGDVRVGPGAEQTVNEVQPEPYKYEPPKPVTTNTEVAPGANTSTNPFSGGSNNEAPKPAAETGSTGASSAGGASVGEN